MKKIAIFIILAACLPAFGINEDIKRAKESEILELELTVIRAKNKIRRASDVRADDFLKLLPDIILSKRSPAEGFEEEDIYIGASFNTGSIFTIAENARKRRGEKDKALRTIQSLAYRIRKLINRKYLLKQKIWDITQKQTSRIDAIESSKNSDKIEELTIVLDGIEIEIEKGMAEIEMAYSNLILK
ncbi:MAG TPA: hypothetical protein P5295_17245 [Spirochaetota bacterium]|nr:hypothetical protein [Spirochaetota bacterium]